MLHKMRGHRHLDDEEVLFRCLNALMLSTGRGMMSCL